MNARKNTSEYMQVTMLGLSRYLLLVVYAKPRLSLVIMYRWCMRVTVARIIHVRWYIRVTMVQIILRIHIPAVYKDNDPNHPAYLCTCDICGQEWPGLSRVVMYRGYMRITMARIILRIHVPVIYAGNKGPDYPVYSYTGGI